MKTGAARERRPTPSVRRARPSPLAPLRTGVELQQATIRRIVQPRLTIGQANDRYEREADRVADKVVANQPVTQISAIGGPLANLGSRKLQAEAEVNDSTEREVQRQPEEEAEEETPVQAKPIQRQPEEEEEPVQAKPIQRQPEDEAEEETPVQAKLIQRQPEEEEEEETPIQAKLIQRQAEDEAGEETPVQAKLIQRQPEEEEEEETPVQAKLIQRQAEDEAEEETPVQAKLIQRQAEEEEEEETPIQAKLIQRQPEEEEEEETPIQAKLIQRQAEDEAEEETPVQALPIQRQIEEDERVVQSDERIPSANAASRALNNASSGSPMRRDVRQRLETAMATDLGHVRVHEDSAAQAAAASINARAFTHQNGIWLGAGQSQSDLHLMAHETTHVLQQGGGLRSGAVSPAPTRVQRIWNPISAVADAVGSAVEWVGDSIGEAVDYIKERASEFVRGMPGYSLFTVVNGSDPITGRRVERNGRNFIEAGLDVIPNGTALKQKLEQEGALAEAAQWLDEQIAALDFSPSEIASQLSALWNSLSLADATRIPTVMNRLLGIIGAPVGRIVRFAGNVAVRLLQIVKDYVVSSLIAFIRERTTAYPLLTVILGRDPISNEAVERTPMALLRGFMQLSESGAEQLRQMEESGSLQRAADWLNAAIDRLNLSWETIRETFSRAWERVTIQNLLDPLGTFRELYNLFAGPVGRIVAFLVEVAARVLGFIKDALIGRLVAYARTVRGYPLITVILGRDPFSEEPVERSTANIVRGFMSLMENGEQQYREMEQSGAIASMTARVEAAMAMLNFTWEYIHGLFLRAWNSFSLQDLVAPLQAFARMLAIFGAPVLRLVAFVWEIVKIAIEVLMEVMNFPIDLIRNIIARAMQAIDDIKRDPIAFLKNLLLAVKTGFQQFFGNILTHLLGGLTGWLFGELRDANINPPADLSFRSILGFVLEVLGITVERIWQKLAERIGQQRVDRIRRVIDRLTGIWSFVRDVMTRGPVAIWEYIQERLSSLWDTVLGAVRNWVVTRIIERVTVRLLSMLDPTGIMAVINGFIAFYNAVQSFIRYLREMLEVVNSFVVGVAELARGNVSIAANFLEGALARAVPIAIGFLANQVGLSGIGRRIGEMIERVRELVDRALTWLVDRAVSAGTAFLNRIGSALGLGGGDDAAGGGAGEWWRKERSTSVAGANHRVFFEGTGARARLMISSGSNQTPQQWLADSRPNLSTDQQRQAHAEASTRASQITRMVGGNQQNIDNRALDSNLDQLMSAVQRARMGSDPQSRLEAARGDLQRLLGSAEDTNQLQTHFEEIRQRYNLAGIEYENIGTPSAVIRLRINPQVDVTINGDKALLTGSRATVAGSGNETVQTRVDWQAGSLSLGSVSQSVGSVMTAMPLANDHGPGQSTNSSSLRALMPRLYTTRTLRSNEKYVAGHLLNHHLGGPNIAHNLFPITARANSDHRSWVERFVRRDIDSGYVGKYEVRVTGDTTRDLGNGMYSVNADFVCTYQRLSAKRELMGSNNQITIQSRYDDSGRNRSPQRLADRPLANLPSVNEAGDSALRVGGTAASTINWTGDSRSNRQGTISEDD